MNVFAREVFEDQVRKTSRCVTTRIEDLSDVLRFNGPGCTSFALKPLQLNAAGVIRSSGTNHLDGYATPGADMLAFVYGPHTAFADETKDAILVVEEIIDLQHDGVGSDRSEAAEYLHRKVVAEAS